MSRPGPLSAGAVIVRGRRAGLRFLLLRAFSHWDFPKGLVEEGESPREAVVREVAEETTLDDLSFDWGDDYIETGPYSRNKTARYYLARTGREDVSLPVNPELGRPEHMEFRWVDLDEAFSLTTPRVRRVLAWAADRLGLRPADHQERSASSP